jgi:hypothetical protein
MSERELRTGGPDCGGDAAAYALGALEPEEAAAFRRHLETCVVCRDELAAFEQAVDVLPAAVPQYQAPASLRRRILTEVRSGAAAGAEAGAAAATGPDRHAHTARRRLRDRHAHTARRRLRDRPRLPLLTGLAAAAAAAIVAIVLATSGSSGTRVITAAVTGPGRAEIRLTGGRAELILTGFPSPPPGEIYEVWLQRGSGAPSPTRTLFGVTTRGGADVGVAGRLTGVSHVLVTAEPAGGTLVPTHAPVIVARLD